MPLQINYLNLSRLHNEEHYQFQTEIKELVTDNNPVTLNIEDEFVAYLKVYTDEGEAIEYIKKSSITADISKADTLRDNTLKGLNNAIKSARWNSNPEIQQAALRLLLVKKHYGDISRKSYDAATAAINSMIRDLNSIYAADISTTGLSGWVTELKANNNAFEALKNKRYKEVSEKTELRMNEVRIRADKAYHKVTKKINSLIIVNGETGYTGFVNEMNVRVESFSNNIARRKGRNGDTPPDEDAPYE